MAPLDPRDVAACRALLAAGSKSFSAASWLLPGRLRAPVAALYAFCRVADDAIDEAPPGGLEAALAGLRARLDAAYAGTPADDPVDRAFSATVLGWDVPRAAAEALLEGFAWDAEGRRYRTLEELHGYCARVASAVGVMMTALMGPRAGWILARAADLGVAMQLTNIARDVGADARLGRVYLPLDWLEQAGIDPAELVARPTPGPALAGLVRRLLDEAEGLYARADRGVTGLPRDCRVAIRAARLIYAAIGDEIAANGYDSVTRRAHTSLARKLWLLARALPAALWRPDPDLQPPLAATRFLVEAARRDGP